MKRIDWLVWLPMLLITLLMLGVFSQVVFAQTVIDYVPLADGRIVDLTKIPIAKPAIIDATQVSGNIPVFDPNRIATQPSVVHISKASPIKLSVDDVIIGDATDILRMRQENETLKQQLQLLSTETQTLSIKLAARKCEVAENYLLLLTIQQGLNEAIQKQDWERVQRVLLLLFDVVHRWGKE